MQKDLASELKKNYQQGMVGRERERDTGGGGGWEEVEGEGETKETFISLGAQRALAQHKEASAEERVHTQLFWQCRLIRRIQNIWGRLIFTLSLFIFRL